MNILLHPTARPQLCATCAATTTGGTRLGRPICTPCAAVAVKAVMQHGISYTEPANNPYPVYKKRADFFEFLALIGGGAL
jgi:hypothetical protein